MFRPQFRHPHQNALASKSATRGVQKFIGVSRRGKRLADDGVIHHAGQRFDRGTRGRDDHQALGSRERGMPVAMCAPAFTWEKHVPLWLCGFPVVRVKQAAQELPALHREIPCSC